MPELGKEQDSGLTGESAPKETYPNASGVGPGTTDDMAENTPGDPVELTDNPAPDPGADIGKEEDPGPENTGNPFALDPRIEALIRQICKEEIGKALGHTVV